MAGPKASVRLEMQGLNRLDKFMRVMSDEASAAYREAWDEAREIMEREVERRNPTSGQVFVGKVTGKGAKKKFLVKVKHPAAASFEFGRVMYWRGYSLTGSGFSGGSKFRSAPGFRPDPIIGVVEGDAAWRVAVPLIETAIQRAIEDMFADATVGAS